MKKDVNSINMAPVSIRWACLRIAGIAMLPIADAPVKNLAALIQLQKKRGNVKITQHEKKWNEKKKWRYLTNTTSKVCELYEQFRVWKSADIVVAS